MTNRVAWQSSEDAVNEAILDRISNEPWASLRPRLVATWIASAAALFAPQARGQQPTPVEIPAAIGDSTRAADSVTSPAVDEARTAFQEGIALAKAQRWALALQALERSDALHPHAITKYNIGYCERQLGHWTRARKMLASSLAAHSGRGAVQLPAELVDAAETYLSEGDRQIARVIVTITPGVVTVDGSPLELAESDGPRPVLLAGTRGFGQAEAPPSVSFDVLVDPGVHVFVLSVKDRADVIANETLAAGSTVSLELRAPDATESSKLPTRPPQAQGPPAERPNRVPAFVAFGIGAAGLAVGTVSGLVAFGKRSDVNLACQGTDAVRCSIERESGNRAADISTGAFIGGGLAVAVGAVLFFVAPRSTPSKISEAATMRSQLRPTFGWGALGLEGRF
jgi:hypothetical protein